MMFFHYDSNDMRLVAGLHPDLLGSSKRSPVSLAGFERCGPGKKRGGKVRGDMRGEVYGVKGTLRTLYKGMDAL